MIRLFLALALLALPVATRAQSAAPAPQGISAAQAKQALDVLNDPARRAQIIGVLQTLAKAAPSAAPPAATPPAPAPAPAPSSVPAAVAQALPLSPNSLGAQLLVYISSELSGVSSSLLGTAGAITDFSLAAASVSSVARDPWAQNEALQTSWRLVLVMAAGLLVQFAIKYLLRRPNRALSRLARRPRTGDEPAPEDLPIAEAEAGQTEPVRRRLPTALHALRRLPLALARLILNLLPPLALLATGYALISAGLATDEVPRLVILAVLHAYVLCRVCTCLARALTGPGEPHLLPCSDATGLYVLRWVRRIAAVAIFGYALAEIGLLFGLYVSVHQSLLKLVSLVVNLFLVTIILQRRAAIAGWIHARPDASGAIALLRNRASRVWHILAIFYLLALWAAWALDIPGGVNRILWLVFASFGIIVIGRLLGAVTAAGLERTLRLPTELAERYPGLESRLGAYHPLLRGVIHGILTALVLLALLEIWGWDALGWLTTGPLGQQLLTALITSGITIAVALAVWEGVNGIIQRRLARLARDGQVGRAARLRTLLPMLRTALFIVVALFAGLMVLSQIGMNIAPLLAGAGVVGLAIGFGSQKLVQDIITGLFLLLENAVQVGDTISLANLTGTVENLSIRTIRLRALDGAVHIIPFSAVTTVTNMSRDFGFAVLDVEAGLNEEPDRIADILRDIAREMRTEPRWQSVIYEDLDVMGVDKFIDNAWVLRVRIKVVPSQRLAVQRELNRRVKYRFDADAIESPFTSYTALQLSPPSPPQHPQAKRPAAT